MASKSAKSSTRNKAPSKPVAKPLRAHDFKKVAPVPPRQFQPKPRKPQEERVMADDKTKQAEEAPDPRVTEVVAAFVPAATDAEAQKKQKELAQQISKQLEDAGKQATGKGDPAQEPGKWPPLDVAEAQKHFFYGDIATSAARRKEEEQQKKAEEQLQAAYRAAGQSAAAPAPKTSGH